jgi:fructokinase
MNVAFHAKNLGADALIYSARGEDKLGEELCEIITERGINTDYIQNNLHPTGTVDVNTSNPSEVKYTIVSPSAWDFIEYTPMPMGHSDFFVFGTLAARNDISRTTLLNLLDGDAYKIMDMNLRAPFFEKELIQELLEKTNLLKVNEQEYAKLSQWFGYDTDPMIGYQQIRQEFGLDKLLITYGSKGASLVTPEGHWKSRTYNITVADTVGAGDSFLAALLWGLQQGNPLQEVLDFAVALGAMVATRKGANPIIRAEEVHDFIAASH